MTPRPKVVAIGGGTGLASVLRGLKHYPISLSGIVTMTDNGHSSGRLSREMGVLPPGDVRKCLAALADDENLLSQLFEYRFTGGRGLSGHSLGNLLLIALSDITGNFESAVRASSKILSIKGEVIPSTLQHVSLLAELNNGQTALGEEDIPILGHKHGIRRISLTPSSIPANPRAVHHIREADLIIVGPGSFYTSVLPNFLIEELRQAFTSSSALKLFICNASTERGETEGYGVADHVSILKDYLGSARIDAVLANNRVVAQSEREGVLGSVRNITTNEKTIADIPIISEDLVDAIQPLFHDANKLAETIWQVFLKPPANASPRRASRSLSRKQS